jgi:hypothetical protein
MGINAKDILITIRLYMDNKFDGFSETFKENEKNDQKINFIHHCQYLIENGWNAGFEEKIEKDQTHFFNLIKTLIVEPKKGAFANRVDISNDAEPIIVYFTKLYLFRLTYETYRDNRDLFPDIDTDWFMRINKYFSDTFERLAKNSRISYSEHPLVSFEDFRKAVEARNKAVMQSINWGINNGRVSVLIGFCCLLAILNTEDIKTRNLCAFLLLCCVLYSVFNVAKPFITIANTSQTISLFQETTRQAEETEIYENENIKKFFFVSDNEIEQLKNRSIIINLS